MKGFARYNIIPGWGYAIEVWNESFKPAIMVVAQAFTHPRNRHHDEEQLHRDAVHDGVMLMREHGITSDGGLVHETDDQCQSVPEDVWARYQDSLGDVAWP